MKSRSNKKAHSTDGMFHREQKTIDRIEKVKNQPDISSQELMDEFVYVGKMYQKMVREMKKITRIGDVNYKKLLDANDQIQKQKNELEELNVQLMEAKATQDKLYSIIAHDLRNPLQFLLFTTDVLHSDYENMDEDAIRSYIGKVFKTVQNMSDLLENLLQWSMSQYGKLECRPRPINFNRLVNEILVFFDETAEKKEISLLSEVDDNISVFADEDMIKSVLRNLVSNALKFTAPCGTVTILAHEQQGAVVTRVKDTGQGIPQEKLDTLFKIGLNYTTDGTAKEKGTGLGLILCKELVEKNNGGINVESEMGKGSSFVFSLPLPSPKN